MLPDFPRLKEAARQYFISKINEKPSNGLLSTIQTISLYEGDSIAMSDIRHSREHEFQMIQAPFLVKNEDLIRHGIGAFLSKFGELSQELETQKEKLVIQKAEEATEAVGNVVSAEHQPLSPSLLIKALEKMSIDFDEDGRPANLVLVVHPDQIADLRRKLAESENDREYQSAFKSLMERKRAEWRERENSRKLVD